MSTTDRLAVFNVTFAFLVVLTVAVFPWWVGFFTIIKWLLP